MKLDKFESFVLAEDNVIIAITENGCVLPMTNNEVVEMLNEWLNDEHRQS